ncbi:MAG: metallophosphoesterase [Desulfotomaculaceae bacterium]
MSAVVALSDLHLGEDSSAANPLLDYVVPAYLKDRPEFRYPPRNNTPIKLNTLLRKTARRYGGIADLVLVGDIMDFALAPYRDCVMQAREFFRQLLEGILPGALVWVPGNHDHHLWVQVYESEYIEVPLRQGRLPIDAPCITGPGRSTGALYGYSRGVAFLLGLLPDHVRDRFWLAYPNYVANCGGENLLFHHGHFFDCVQSWIGTTLLEAANLAELEMFNAAYLDFVWYGSGQAGRLSEQLENFYEEIRWLGERSKLNLDFITMQHLFKQMIGHNRRGGDRNSTLNPSLANRITNYLSYIERERKTGVAYPADFALIFGHTHRPLEARLAGRQVYNTGGWTVDEIWPGEENLNSAIFIAAPGERFEVQRVPIDREIYNFCHRLNHAIREEIKIDFGAPG